MKRTFTQTALAAALMIGLSQAAYANGINSQNGVPVEIGAGGTLNILTVTPSGQVGINNTSPGAGYMLDVTGDTKIGGNMNVTGATLLGPRHLQLGADTNRFGDSGLRLWNNGSSPGNDSAALTIMPNNGGTADLRLYNANDPTGLNVGVFDIGFNSSPSTLKFSLGSFGAGTAPTAFSFINGAVGIGTETPHSSLDLSTETDAISLPKGSSAEAPSAPALGMMRYNTDINKVEYWNGSAWLPIGTAVNATSCEIVYGTNANTIKGACGYNSSTYCPSGYTAVVGGSTSASNDQLQNSDIILNESTSGWHVSFIDAGGCHLNDISNGTTASGTAPDLYFTDGINRMDGDSFVVCCP